MNSAGDRQGPATAGLDPRTLLVFYVRAMAFVFLLSGLRRWGIILGPLAPGGDFLDLPVQWQVATVFFGVFDLVAAVGLWLLASWGTVVWLITALTEVVLHGVFVDVFGFQPVLLAFHLVSVLIYATLTLFYERSRKA